MLPQHDMTVTPYVQEDEIYRRAAMDGWLYLDVRDVNNIKEVTYSQ